MITEKFFEIFAIQGLDERMNAIRKNIQPEFQVLGEKLVPFLDENCSAKFYLHIAQHRRRTKYAPEITWCAFSQQKRGYKMEPHFQIVVNEKYLAIWLSFIDHPKNEREIASTFINNPDIIKSLPKSFAISTDHTKTDVEKMANTNIYEDLERWKNIKKSELQIGKTFAKDYFTKNSPDEFFDEILVTLKRLIPIYQEAMNIAAR
ncbi:DUF1054 family protein [Liquorilactobacillus cacaonum]|uniref:Uncharacterized protein n=1 Tax=Liquorilactobacillus cacaonum DSM 21116 TaxID=1423729 RepID=A0A0R2CKU6_9LACO|nr:DUF1054 family protein [Liquorilactobacillus cacaonum]KRM91914.1 hypothetical protein FC80_GL000092 [Liquorilactobacillus cacaonum DSM 21116]